MKQSSLLEPRVLSRFFSKTHIDQINRSLGGGRPAAGGAEVEGKTGAARKVELGQVENPFKLKVAVKNVAQATTGVKAPALAQPKKAEAPVMAPKVTTSTHIRPAGEDQPVDLQERREVHVQAQVQVRAPGGRERRGGAAVQTGGRLAVEEAAAD